MRKEKYKRHGKIYRCWVPQTGNIFQKKHYKTSEHIIEKKSDRFCVFRKDHVIGKDETKEDGNFKTVRKDILRFVQNAV